MYTRIWEDYKAQIPHFPSARRPRIGEIIQEIRVSKAIPQYRFAKLTGINLSTLKSIENDHLQSTSLDNLEKCAKHLDITLDDLLLGGRERDPANFFVCKRKSYEPLEGIKLKKRHTQSWYKTIRLPYPHFDLIPLTPPLRSQKDFFAARIHLPPKRALESWNLNGRGQVIGFISEGHNLKLRYAGKETVVLTANQGFLLDGDRAHSLVNEDETIAAVIYWIAQIPDSKEKDPKTKRAASHSLSFSLPQALEKLRAVRSQRRGHPLPLKYLADLTDGLNDNKIRALLSLKKKSDAIAWDKIENILGATGTSMEEFLGWARGENPPLLRICTARDRALIDYSHYWGLKIYSVLSPSAENHFHCGELHLEGRKGGRHASWERKDKTMIALYVEEGEIRVQAGKNRLASLEKGESVYFDGSLGYLLNNPGDLPAKCFFAAHPAIRY